MTNLVIISLATAFILTAVEELLIFLGKWRGLLALLLSFIASYSIGIHSWGMLVFLSLAGSFGGMTCAMLVPTLIESRDPRIVRGLPRRVPPL
jgi:hypothetical protein